MSQAKQVKPRAARAVKPAAAPAPAPVAAAAPVAVALRGGISVAAVVATGKAYRTAAAHNRAWWATVTGACASGPASVARLVGQGDTGLGVPSHFVGYCIRRGYLKEAPKA